MDLVSDAPTYKGIPGSVVGVDDKSFTVKTSDAFVRVIEYTPDAKVKIGDRFK